MYSCFKLAPYPSTVDQAKGSFQGMPPCATYMPLVDANACFGRQNAYQLITGKSHLAVFVKHVIRCQ